MGNTGTFSKLLRLVRLKLLIFRMELMILLGSKPRPSLPSLTAHLSPILGTLTWTTNVVSGARSRLCLWLGICLWTELGKQPGRRMADPSRLLQSRRLHAQSTAKRENQELRTTRRRKTCSKFVILPVAYLGIRRWFGWPHWCEHTLGHFHFLWCLLPCSKKDWPSFTVAKYRFG